MRYFQIAFLVVLFSWTLPCSPFDTLFYYILAFCPLFLFLYLSLKLLSPFSLVWTLFFFLPPPPISLYSFPLYPTSSTSLSSVITFVFFPSPATLSSSHSSILTSSCDFFLPVDLHSSLLIISHYPLIYHLILPLCTLLFTFGNSCSLSALLHFNPGTVHSSWRAEHQNIGCSQNRWDG